MLWGCVVMTAAMAVPVPDPDKALARPDTRGDGDAVARGKRIYFTRCAQCHSALTVKQYSPAQWERLLPRMVRKSKLDKAQVADLGAYMGGVLSVPE